MYRCGLFLERRKREYRVMFFSIIKFRFLLDAQIEFRFELELMVNIKEVVGGFSVDLGYIVIK